MGLNNPGVNSYTNSSEDISNEPRFLQLVLWYTSLVHTEGGWDVGMSEPSGWRYIFASLNEKFLLTVLYLSDTFQKLVVAPKHLPMIKLFIRTFKILEQQNYKGEIYTHWL